MLLVRSFSSSSERAVFQSRLLAFNSGTAIPYHWLHQTSLGSPVGLVSFGRNMRSFRLRDIGFRAGSSFHRIPFKKLLTADDNGEKQKQKENKMQGKRVSLEARLVHYHIHTQMNCR
jgi:hypothetical protein